MLDSYRMIFVDDLCLVSVNKSDDSTIFEQCSHVNQDIFRTAFNLHQQGLLMPWVFQCLYKVNHSRLLFFLVHFKSSYQILA